MCFFRPAFREVLRLQWLQILPPYKWVGEPDYAVARSPLTPRRALTTPHYSPLPCQERAGKWLHQQRSSALDTLANNISTRGGRGGREGRGGRGGKSWRKNGERGECERSCWRLWLWPGGKMVLAVLLALHQEVQRPPRCQKRKFGSDRCGDGGRWSHLLQPPQRNQRIQFWAELCQPSDFSSASLDFRIRGGKRIYQRSRLIQSGMASCPAESNEPCLGADLSEAPNIPPVVAKAPSQCEQSFKSDNPPSRPTFRIYFAHRGGFFSLQLFEF